MSYSARESGQIGWPPGGPPAPGAFVAVHLGGKGVWHLAVRHGIKCQSGGMDPARVKHRRDFFREPHPRAKGVCRRCFPAGICVCDEPLFPQGGICSRCERDLPKPKHGRRRVQRTPGVSQAQYQGEWDV